MVSDYLGRSEYVSLVNHLEKVLDTDKIESVSYEILNWLIDEGCVCRDASHRGLHYNEDDDEINDLKDTISDLEDDIDNLESEVEDLEDERDRLKEQLKVANERLDLLEE